MEGSTDAEISERKAGMEEERRKGNSLNSGGILVSGPEILQMMEESAILRPNGYTQMIYFLQ